MGRRQIVDGVEKAARRERRQQLGSLKSLVIRPTTIARYEKAFRAFLQFLSNQKLSLASTRQKLDNQFCDYLNWLWEDGESLSLAGDTLSAIQHFQPSCKHNISGAWRMLRTWQTHEVPSRAPPFTWDSLQILLGYFHSICPSVSLGLLVAFKCLLRTGELMCLTSNDFLISPDRSTLIVHLGLTKTADKNPAASTVTLVDSTLAMLVKAWQNSVKPNAKLIPWTQYQFRSKFRQALSATGLSEWGFRPYSLRRGDATDLFLTTRNYSVVQHMGRWSSEKVMRQYIETSTALLTNLRLRLSPQQRTLISYWISVSHVEPLLTQSRRGRGKKRK